MGKRSGGALKCQNRLHLVNFTGIYFNSHIYRARSHGITCSCFVKFPFLTIFINFPQRCCCFVKEIYLYIKKNVWSWEMHLYSIWFFCVWIHKKIRRQEKWIKSCRDQNRFMMKTLAKDHNFVRDWVLKIAWNHPLEILWEEMVRKLSHCKGELCRWWDTFACFSFFEWI